MVVKNHYRLATLFVVFLGIVSLFADITYEGARSITGPYLAILGANAAIVGIVAGLGELIGYGVRLISGYLSDKTGRYWLITFLGYGITAVSIPLLALAGSWHWAAALIIAERFGKAIRNPARDAMISYASQEIGHGWAFGLHGALDQIGAILGPLLIAGALYLGYSYAICFALLTFPAILSIVSLSVAQACYPDPKSLEKDKKKQAYPGFSHTFWVYLAGVSLVAAGFLDFALIAYHFQKTSQVTMLQIPVLYAIAMAVEGVSSLVLGKLFDFRGLNVLIFTTFISAFAVPFIFLDGVYSLMTGMILWGIGLGSQATIMRAFVAMIVSPEVRGSAYGVLNMGFGLAWFLGSVLMGLLYDISSWYLIIFSVSVQLLSLPFFISIRAKV